MINPDERREVARKLRDCIVYAKRHDLDGDCDMGSDKCVETRCTLYNDIASCIEECGNLNLSAEQVLTRLADLIEPQEITEDTSDGYHTFRQLYYQRMMLFAVLVAEHRDLAWKTHRHEDGEPCFGGGWFLVTIETPAGPYGYHYEDKYWDLFDCDEIPKAKPWDGYDESDVGRLMSLVSERKNDDD